MNWEKRFTSWVGSKSSVIIHTIFFVVMFSLPFLGIAFDTVMLVLTTLVSLEAIYLAIFIQMSVNENTESLQEVEDDIDEIQEDIDEIQEDVDEIQEDVEDVKEEKEDDTHDLDGIRSMLTKLLEEVDRLKAAK